MQVEHSPAEQRPSSASSKRQPLGYNSLGDAGPALAEGNIGCREDDLPALLLRWATFLGARWACSATTFSEACADGRLPCLLVSGPLNTSGTSRACQTLGSLLWCGCQHAEACGLAPSARHRQMGACRARCCALLFSVQMLVALRVWCALGCLCSSAVLRICGKDALGLPAFGHTLCWLLCLAYVSGQRLHCAKQSRALLYPATEATHLTDLWKSATDEEFDACRTCLCVSAWQVVLRQILLLLCVV